MFPSVARYRFWWWLWALAGLAVVFDPHAVLAESDPPPAREFRDPDASAEKERTVTIGIYLLIVVAVGVVAFLILMMLWGARVRRQARKPLPNVSPNDPLWYLKRGKRASREPENRPGVSDQNREKPETGDSSNDSSSA